MIGCRPKGVTIFADSSIIIYLKRTAFNIGWKIDFALHLFDNSIQGHVNMDMSFYWDMISWFCDSTRIICSYARQEQEDSHF